MKRRIWSAIKGFLLVAVMGVPFCWWLLSQVVVALDAEPIKGAPVGMVERLQQEQTLADARAFLLVDNSVENPVNHSVYAVSE